MMGLERVVGILRRAPLGARHGPIGVELSSEAIRLVQLSRRGSGDLSVQARATLAYPTTREATLASPPLMRQLIRDALSRDRFSGSHAVVGMPAGQFKTLSVNFRSRAGASDDEVIAGLMAERLDGDLNDYVIDYLPVRGQARDAEKLAIVAVSQRADVIALLEAFEASPLTVDALEIGPIAIRRLAGALREDDSQLLLIVNTGREASYLTLLSGRRLLMDQSIEFSERRLLEALMQALDMSEESALALVKRTGLHAGAGQVMSGHREGETGIFNTLLEIVKPELQRLIEETDRAFMYAAAQARGGGEARIWLLGALARWPGADRVLAELTHLPVLPFANPLSRFGVEDEDTPLTAPAPKLAVATGLAMRGFVDDE